MVGDKKLGLVSVIIPCHNEEEHVTEAIESVLAQTHEPIETIVIDDGSTDDSLERIRAFDENIIWRTGENQGACHARNWGAELSSGRFLMFLDADDRISPTAIAALVRELDSDDHAVAACPWSFLKRKTDGWEEEEVDISIHPPEGDPIYGWLSRWYIPPCAILWSRAAYEKTDGWDESLRANQDADLMLRAFLNGTRLVQTRRGQSFYRKHEPEESISARRSARAIESRVRVLKRTAHALEQRGRLERYREALGKKFYRLARRAALVSDELYTECMERAEKYATEPADQNGTTLAHRVVSKILGLQRKEKIAAKLGEWGVGSKERRKSARLQSQS